MTTKDKAHAVRQAVIQSITGAESDEEAADRVMDLLDDMKLVVYSADETLPMLSSAGKMLMLVMEYPQITLREAAMRLGITEANARRSMGNLVTRGLVGRERVLRKNVYTVNVAAILEHPDIRRFLLSITNAVL